MTGLVRLVQLGNSRRPCRRRCPWPARGRSSGSRVSRKLRPLGGSQRESETSMAVAKRWVVGARSQSAGGGGNVRDARCGTKDDRETHCRQEIVGPCQTLLRLVLRLVIEDRSEKRLSLRKTDLSGRRRRVLIPRAGGECASVAWLCQRELMSLCKSNRHHDGQVQSQLRHGR